MANVYVLKSFNCDVWDGTGDESILGIFSTEDKADKAMNEFVERDKKRGEYDSINTEDYEGIVFENRFGEWGYEIDVVELDKLVEVVELDELVENA